MNIIFCIHKSSEPRNYDAFSPGQVSEAHLGENPLELPTVKMLSCIRRKRGNKVSIKLVLRSHSAE